MGSASLALRMVLVLVPAQVLLLLLLLALLLALALVLVLVLVQLLPQPAVLLCSMSHVASAIHQSCPAVAVVAMHASVSSDARRSRPCAHQVAVTVAEVSATLLVQLRTVTGPWRS